MPLKKLTPEEKASTEELIAAIEHKDRRFRLFQTLFMVGTFIALMVIIGAQQRTLSGVHQQVEQARANAKAEAQQNEDQQTKIIRRLNCMVVFFSQENRTNLSISDINKCTLNRDRSEQQFFADPESTPSEQPPNLSGSSSSTSSSEGEQAVLPEQPVTERPESTPPEIEPRPPVAIETPIIDIPLCVPLLDVCVRQ